MTVDFGWDWSDRSPQFVELHVSYDDPPQAPLLTARLDFAGSPTPRTLTVTPPPGSAELLPLSFELKTLPTGNWGTPQDKPNSPPETRYYRLTSTTQFTFGGKAKRSISVQARGQTHVDARMIPHYNISPFGPPFVAEAYDAAPPPRPLLPEPPEAPQWATLRDSSGISRAVLIWPASGDVAGYVLYEATETTLLAALGQQVPETTEAFTTRLALLRNKNLSAQRRNFRRVHKELILTNSWEVELPRGSTVMHFYAITAVSRNQIESAWPQDSKQFIAIAAARTASRRRRRSRRRSSDTPAGPKVDLDIAVGTDGAAATVDLYRVSDDKLAENVDTMGLPIKSISAVGGAAHHTADHPAGLAANLVPRRRLERARRPQRVHRGPLGSLGRRVGHRSAQSRAGDHRRPRQRVPLDARGGAGQLGDRRSLRTRSTRRRITASSRHTTSRALGTFTAWRAARHAHARGDPAAVRPRPGEPPDRPRHQRTRNRLYAWLHRPAADQPFRLDLKIIDPLGRIGHFALDVPPIPPTPPPVVTNVDPQQVLTPATSSRSAAATSSSIPATPSPSPSPARSRSSAPRTNGRSSCRVVQPTSRTAIVVEVPDPESGHDSEDFAIFLRRSDGLEVKVLDDFFLAIL